MKFEELKSNIKSEIAPCYLINGGESFLTTNALKMIEETIDFSCPDINKNIFYDDTIKTAKDIVEACEELPFCDNKRLVIVHDYLGKKNEQEKKIFLNYLKNPNPTTCLVFFSTTKSEFFSTLEKGSNISIVECEKLSIEGLDAVISTITKKLQINLDLGAVSKLKNFCNFSISKIETELNKFSTIFSKDYIITEKDIENYVVKDLEYSIFDLTYAISRNDKQTAFLLADDMIKNKEQPITIISTISNHFRRLFFIARSKFTTLELANYLSIKEYSIKKYAEQARGFSIKKLKTIFDLCVETEFKCKSGEMEGKNGLIYLLSAIFS